MKKIFQKTIAITYFSLMLVILPLLSFPNRMEATGPLSISADIYTLAPFQTAQITATIDAGTIFTTADVGFRSDPTGANWVPSQNCTITRQAPFIPKCTVSFSANNGVYKVTASTFINGTKYESDLSIIVIAGGAPQTGYHLLSPLPDTKGGFLTDFDPGTKTGNTTALGSYLNLMIKIFIGICAILAVIMIVMGGIEYMTSELISNKEHGKERILGAVFGLLLALGAYTILNQINPDILKTDLGSLAIQQVAVMVETETAATAVTSNIGSIPTGPTTLCSAGIKQTTTGFIACGSIAQNIDSLVNAAKQAGLNIGGGGYRSADAQKALRIQNCNGNFTDASASCNPLTALPGASNHNNGLAFDLTCSGTTIQSTSNACFVWLQANAGTYGLHNLATEPWHWSVDGR